MILNLLIKSRVAAHVRHEHSGHLTLVKEHQTKVVKKPEPAKRATVTKLPDLQAEAKKLANPYKLVKFRTPQVLEDPVTANGKMVDTATHHLGKKPGIKNMKPGAEVKYRQEGVDVYMRRGNLVRETEKAWFIMPARSRDMFKPEVIKLDKVKDTLMSTEDYKKKFETKEKTPIITSEGDRTMARHNLTAEELLRRKTLVEQRLGYKEDKIIEHPSFIGPAIKIVSGLAIENGISPALAGKPTATLWQQAVDQNYGEMLQHYFMGAMKAWRRELANPLVDAAGARLETANQTENNIREFKDVLRDKRHSSYTHMVMEKEGKGAAIAWLQELRRNRDLMQDQDISDMHEDPNARHLLAERSSQPKQLAYTLHVNNESMAEDVAKVVNTLGSLEREIVKIKFGFGEYGKIDIDGKEAGDRGKLAVSNERIAEVLNGKNILNGKLKWTRNTVGEKVAEVIQKLASNATKEELSYHVDEAMGRPVWKSLVGALVDELCKSIGEETPMEYFAAEEPTTRIPKDFHPEGFFKAGSTEYEIRHEGDEAVMVSGGTFDDLFKAIQDEQLIEAVGKEVGTV
jgi:hypothetical protein